MSSVSPERRARLEQKRAEAKRLNQRSKRKMARLKAKQIIVQGTKWDPTKSSRAIQRMGLRQLESAINRMSTFNSRKTQFVRGEHDQPVKIGSREWRDARKKGEEAKKMVEKFDESRSKYADIVVAHPEGMFEGATVRSEQERGKLNLYDWNYSTFLMSGMSLKEWRERYIFADGEFIGGLEANKKLAEIKAQVRHDRKMLADRYAVKGQKKLSSLLRSMSDEEFVAWAGLVYPGQVNAMYSSDADEVEDLLDDSYEGEDDSRSLWGAKQIIARRSK